MKSNDQHAFASITSRGWFNLPQIQGLGWCMRLAKVSILAAIFIATVAPPLFAQVLSGAISGSVTDPAGAAVAGASVVVTNQGTDVSAKTTTDGSGFYTVEGLPDGSYSVDVKNAGLQENLRKDIHLTPGQRFGYTVALQVGSSSSSVIVTSKTPVEVNTETSEAGGTISAKQINNLMLNGRNFQSLAGATPQLSKLSFGAVASESLSASKMQTIYAEAGTVKQLVDHKQ
jgi:hypothetical protein